MNRQFIWVVCGILVIHIVAISAFMKSSSDRRREQSRASLPTAEEMGTVVQATDESVPEEPVVSEEPPVSESIFDEIGKEPETEEQLVALVGDKPLKPTYTPDAPALPEPAPLHPEVEKAVVETVEEAPVSQPETVLGPELVEAPDDSGKGFTVPAPVEKPDEPAPTKVATEITQVNTGNGQVDAASSYKEIPRVNVRPVAVKPVVNNEPGESVVTQSAVLRGNPAAGRSAFLKPILKPQGSDASSAPVSAKSKSTPEPKPTAARVVKTLDPADLPRVTRIRR